MQVHFLLDDNTIDYRGNANTNHVHSKEPVPK